MSRQDDEKTNNFKSKYEKGAVTKNQLLTKEMRSRHRMQWTTRQPGCDMELRSRDRIY